MNEAVSITCHPVGDGNASVVTVGLNRPEVANAFNDKMLVELQNAFEQIAQRENCRAVLIYGKGKHFSAGADLNWMRDSAKLSYDENVADANRLTSMFESLVRLPMPSIAAVGGAAFGGAVGLVAACDIVIAKADAKLCLSEVKVGLIPAVIAPYVARRLPYGAIRRFGLSGQVISAETALDLGLVDRIVDDKQDFVRMVREEINALLSAGPAAQRNFKALISKLQNSGFAQSNITAEAIAATRISVEGQAGLASFFEKKLAPWVLKLDDHWNWD